MIESYLEPTLMLNSLGLDDQVNPYIEIDGVGCKIKITIRIQY